MLFKLWIFEFDFNSLVSFLIGSLFGVSLLALLYSLLVVSSIKSKKYVVKTKNETVTDEEIMEIINNATLQFKDKSLKGAKNTIGHCWCICSNLTQDIARKFFPKSKRPFAELSVDELLLLAIYISNRINELIDRPGLRLVKKVKLSTILALGDAKNVIEASELMKMTKKYKIMKMVDTVKGALNILNPVYWFRKTVMNSTLDFAVHKLCLAVIEIVGEETYKIYSKRVFDEEKNLDLNVNGIVDELDEEMKDISDEDITSYLLSQGLVENDRKKKKEK